MPTTFSPSATGLHFPNAFRSMPLLHLDVLGTRVPIGDASNGLCGGMVFTARDYCDAGRLPPLITTPPDGGRLFDYLVRRLFDSFNIPSGVTTYMWLMNPTLPDHETLASRAGVAPHGRAWVMINDEWPKIQRDLDEGRPCPLGLIRIKSLDPGQLGRNHQVLAYGYQLSGTDLLIRIYDPNYPNRDDVTININIANPETTTSVSQSTGETLFCFFRCHYSFSTPLDDSPQLRVVVEPAQVPVAQPVSVLVRALDAATDAPIPGTITLEGRAVGTTGMPFTFTFAPDGATGTVNASGYPATEFSVQAVEDPQCSSLRSRIAAHEEERRQLQASKQGLNPRNRQDLLEIRRINEEIERLSREMDAVRAQAQALSCR